MKKAALVVAVVVVLAMAGIFLVGRFVMSAEGDDSYVVSNPPYGATPEWEAYRRAMEKGEEGFGELQELMTTPDDAVAQQAALKLFRAGEEGAFMFFDKLPEVSAGVKYHLRYDSFGELQFEYARQAIEGPDGSARDGAALFLRLPYSRQSLNSAVVSGIGDTLVETIPDATGDYAVDLAFTIGLYPPGNLDGLKRHLDSSDPNVRRLAVQTLGKLGDEDALGAVERMRRDGAVEVSEAANVAAASIEKAVNQRLVAASWTRKNVSSPESEREKAKKRLGMP